MSQIDMQKRLLIAESELNRVQLVREAVAVREEVRALADQAATIGSITVSVASLVAGLAAIQRGQVAPDQGKSSWWQTLLSGAGLASSLWQAWSPAGRERSGKPGC